MTNTATKLPDSLAQLAVLSNFYGKNPDYVLAGGGNTSVKIDGVLYIKGSGTELAKVTAEQFVALDREKVAQTLLKSYSKDPLNREEEIKNDLLAALTFPEKGGRPSVETALHNMFQTPFVVHLHPSLVNTLTCSQKGEKIVAKLFGNTSAWLGYTDPGYTLAKAVEKRLAVYRKAHAGKDPEYLFIQNHGPFIPADSPAHAKRKISSLFSKLRAFHANKKASPLGARKGEIKSDRENLVCALGPTLRSALGEGKSQAIAVFDDCSLVLDFVATVTGKKCLAAGPMTPDQIVYCKSFPLWVPCRDGESADAVSRRAVARLAEFRAKRGYDPKVVAVEGLGIFAMGSTIKAAQTVRDVYVDALKIVRGTFAAGGPHFMTPRQYRFIDDWEVEQYRRKVSAAAASAGPLQNKVAVVIGAGKAAGLESVVEGLSKQGACVALLNAEIGKAKKVVDAITSERGCGAALALKANSVNSRSMSSAAGRIVRAYGGVDLMIHVVAIAKARGKKSSDVDAAVIATGPEFSVSFKTFVPVMIAQNSGKGGFLGDIIQIIQESNGACGVYRLAIDKNGIGTATSSISVDKASDLTDAILSLIRSKGKR